MRAEDFTDIPSEAGVIATLIYHPDYSFYSEHLLPNHFWNRENRYIYHAICILAQRGVTGCVDSYSIIEALKSGENTSVYADELQIQALNDFIDNSECIARGSLEEYNLCVDNVLNAAFRRDTFSALKRCEAMCMSDQTTDLERDIYDLLDGVMTEFSTGDDIPEFKDVVDDLWEDVVAHQGEQTVGYRFKFEKLNDYLTIEPSELVVLGAPAKGAKSMFMMNTAVDLLRQGKSVMYIDSELSSRMFLCRLVSHLAQVEFRRVKTGAYSEEESERIDEAIAWIKQQKFCHMYFPILDDKQIYTAVKRIYHKFGGLNVVILDYLKATGNADAYATYAELGKTSDLLKNTICGSMGIAGLAAAQMTQHGRMADSAKIERNASSILYLVDKTDEEMQVDGPECGNKKLIVARNRNGMQHVDGEYLSVGFNGNTCTLYDVKQHVPHPPF